ncbi:MAG: tetratricopeptide repeat protein [Deltaproteobacteria bacterium]|nr:tetratricopeptide repeat protein [Deltaproteobacteria bacterium]
MMQEKIKFYREIFSLDSNSKVFFPLAGMYLEAGLKDEAETVLRQGLERHPEHMEARLLLIRVCHEKGKGDEAGALVRELMNSLHGCPPFFQIWSQELEREGRSEAAMILSLLTSHFGSKPVSVKDIFSAGLKILLADRGQDRRASAKSEVEQGAVVEEEWEEYPPDESPQPTEDLAGAVLTVPVEEDLQEPDQDEDAEEVDESLIEGGVRTRSMADVLFSQGEYRKALDIYTELWRESLPGSDRRDLESQVAKARTALEEGAHDQDGGEPDQADDVVGRLEDLAERLEQRARKA